MARFGKRARWWMAALLSGASATALGRAAPAIRWFEDRPVAWSEHDDGNVAKVPEANHLQELVTSITIRDNRSRRASPRVSWMRPPSPASATARAT